MNLAFDSTAVAVSAGSSWAHTCSGSDRFLIVTITQQSPIQHNPTSVTYNGVAMTKLPVNGFNGSQSSIFLYYLINPSSGTHNVVMTFALGTGWGASISYTGAKSIQPDSYNGEAISGSAGSYSILTNVQESNCWQLLAVVAEADNVTTASSSTARQENVVISTDLGVPFIVFSIYDTNGIVPAGSQSMGWSNPTPPTTSFNYGILFTITATDSVPVYNVLFFNGD